MFGSLETPRFEEKLGKLRNKMSSSNKKKDMKLKLSLNSLSQSK